MDWGMIISDVIQSENVSIYIHFQTGNLISDHTIQIGESTATETGDIFNHAELNEEKPLKQNQVLERLDSLSSSNLNQGERRDSNSSAQVSFEASGVRPKKPCNCTKSACLKL